MVRAPQPELGYFQGQPSGLDGGLESPCLPSSCSCLWAWLTVALQLLPLQPVSEAAWGSPAPSHSAGGEGEAGPGSAPPAGTDALTLCV